MRINESTKLIRALMLTMILVASACATPQINSAIDRVKPAVADHAEALAGDDVERMRETGLVVVTLITAYAGW